MRSLTIVRAMPRASLMSRSAQSLFTPTQCKHALLLSSSVLFRFSKATMKVTMMLQREVTRMPPKRMCQMPVIITADAPCWLSLAVTNFFRTPIAGLAVTPTCRRVATTHRPIVRQSRSPSRVPRRKQTFTFSQCTLPSRFPPLCSPPFLPLRRTKHQWRSQFQAFATGC